MGNPIEPKMAQDRLILKCWNCDFGRGETVVSVYRKGRKIGEISVVGYGKWTEKWFRGSSADRIEMQTKLDILNAEKPRPARS